MAGDRMCCDGEDACWQAICFTEAQHNGTELELSRLKRSSKRSHLQGNTYILQVPRVNQAKGFVEMVGASTARQYLYSVLQPCQLPVVCCLACQSGTSAAAECI